MWPWHGCLYGEQRTAPLVEKKDQDFYMGPPRTARFSINTVLPVTLGKIAAIMSEDNRIVEMAGKSFGGK